MSQAQESRPGDQTKAAVNLEDTPIVPAGHEDLADFICRNKLAWHIYIAGYEAGTATAFKAAQLDQEQQAELAARRFYALESYEVDHRRLAKSAAEWIDVEKARTAPHSPYMPSNGDSRYCEGAA